MTDLSALVDTLPEAALVLLLDLPPRTSRHYGPARRLVDLGLAEWGRGGTFSVRIRPTNLGLRLRDHLQGGVF